MPVEVVGRDVEQYRDLRREAQRVLELKRGHLASDDRVGRERPGERAQRGADVPGHRDRDPAGAEDMADQLDRGRLAVRSRDRDEVVGQQPPAELELAEHRDSARARAANER